MATVLVHGRPDGARTALVALSGVVAAALGVGLLALVPEAARLPPGGRLVPVCVVIVGWGFAGLGVLASLRRPDTALGPLMIAFGLAVLLSGWSISDAELPYLLSAPADALALALVIHLLLAFPSGRLEGRAARFVVAASYATAIAPQLIALPLAQPAADPGCGDCPDNPLLISSHEDFVESLLAVQSAAAVALAVAAVVLAIRRARGAGPAERRAAAPLALAGAVLLALAAVSLATQALDLPDAVQKAAQLVFVASFAGLPIAFLVGLERSRFFRGAAVARFVERLALAPPPGGGEAALAAALGDPSLTVAYWLPERAAYVDRSGRPVALPPAGDGAVATEVIHRGRRVGALVHRAADADLMGAAASAAGLALENDRLEVELRARLEALRASRARVVEVGDAERRRLGRDLHDGAQQRLVSLLIDLQLARQRLDSDPQAARDPLDRALGNARAAVEELRELAAGIHPAVLSQRGLEAALESLTARSAVPVELDVVLSERLPAGVEAAAYFVVAEALTNVAKHARATHGLVSVRRADGVASVEIRDDGCGGADAAGGSGLQGLEDRVGALDGTLDLESPPGGGTVVRARFPLR